MLRRVLTPLIVILLGIFVTLRVGEEVESVQKRLQISKLEANMERWISVMEFSSEKQIGLARTLTSLIDRPEGITLADFEAQAANAIKLSPDLEAVFWTPVVNAEQRVAYEASASTRYPEFAIQHFSRDAGFTPALPQAVYRPVYYMMGRDYTERYLGWDLSSYGELASMFDDLHTRDKEANTRLLEERDYPVSMRFIPVLNDMLNHANRPVLQMLLAVPLRASVQLADGSRHSGESSLVFLMNFSPILNYFSDVPGGDKLNIAATIGSGDDQRLVFELGPKGSERDQDYVVRGSFTNSAASSWNVIITPGEDYFVSLIGNQKGWVQIIGMTITLFLSLFLYFLQRRAALVEELVEQRTDELQQANLELDRLSRTDYLTHVANRRYFEESLEAEWSRAIRGKHSVTLLMIDVDCFKAYNDRYGHIEGDECLQAVAKTLVETAKRPADQVARFGGEEFVLLLPETDEGAMALAERCRQKIEDLGIEHEESEAGKCVTVSIGVATLTPEAATQSARALVKAADEALYQAKQQGRNRVVAS